MESESLLKELELAFDSSVWVDPQRRLLELEKRYIQTLDVDYSVLR